MLPLANQLLGVSVQKETQLERFFLLLLSWIVGISHSHQANLDSMKERKEKKRSAFYPIETILGYKS